MKKTNTDSAKRSAPQWHGSHWHHDTWWHTGHTDIMTYGSHWHHDTWWHMDHTDTWWHMDHTDIMTYGDIWVTLTSWHMGHTDIMTHGGIWITLTSWHMMTYGSHWHHDTWWHRGHTDMTHGDISHVARQYIFPVHLLSTFHSCTHARSIQQLTLPRWASEPNQQIQAMQRRVWRTFNATSEVPVILHGNLAHVSCHFIIIHSASWNNHGGFGKQDFLWPLYSPPAFLNYLFSRFSVDFFSFLQIPFMSTCIFWKLFL